MVTAGGSRAVARVRPRHIPIPTQVKGVVKSAGPGLDPQKHKLRVPEGWATAEEHLRMGICGVRLLLTDGTVLEAAIEVWQRYGIPIDRGFGQQVCLPQRYWRVTRPGEPLAEQLSLF